MSILEKKQYEVERYMDNFQLVSHWLEACIAGIRAVNYFQEMNYQKIAIYGMGELANRLCEDLERDGICISYGIDRDIANCPSRISNIYSLNDDFPKVDVIVVTPFYAYDEIKQILEEKCDYPIVSLEEVIWSL